MVNFVHDHVAEWETKNLPEDSGLPSDQPWCILAGLNKLDGRKDHACVIMHKLIFDADEMYPLPLNQENLNRICVGEDSAFDFLGPLLQIHPVSKNCAT